MTDTDDLPQLFEDTTDEYHAAATIVDTALNSATGDITPDEADGLVARAQLRSSVTIDERAHDLATRATRTATQR